jgi:beta-phosphoglucomutase-like phosphatase (HAD superfamily)
VNRQPAVIVDMDGTLCDVSTVIHLQAEPDGFNAFHKACARCPPHRAVIDWLLDHHSRGHEILIVTGRDAWTRGLTEQWLAEHLPIPAAGLHMRRDGDFRSNTAVKREIHGRLALTYDIRSAIDDDPEIIGLWQEIGIPVAIVVDGGRVVERLVTDSDMDGIGGGHAPDSNRSA